MKTIGSKLSEYNGIGPGFDAVRLLLALGVVLWHSFPLTVGSPRVIYQTPFWLIVNSMVPMFFALSGFLVIGSALRLSVKDFALNRFARIVPGLAAVVFICTFILGPLVTRYELGFYFQNAQTYRYLLNIVGLTAYKLPGVFEYLPYENAVNGSLWTVRYEYACYMIVGFLIAISLISKPIAIWLILLFFLLTSTYELVGENIIESSLLYSIVSHKHFVLLCKIVPFFFVGSLIYLYRNIIVWDWRIAVGCILLVVLLGYFVDASMARRPALWAAISLPLTYIVVWAGLIKLPRPWFFGHGDLSYGVYLWHFPILQILILLTGVDVWWKLGLMSIFPILTIAFISWRLVEKPALEMRRRFKIQALATDG